MEKIIIAIIILAFIIINSFSLGRFVYNGSMQFTDNQRTSLDNITKELKDMEQFGLAEFRNKYDIKELEIESSREEHKIPGELILSGESTDQIIIMVHGSGGNRRSVYPYAELFLEAGIDVLTYDQRSSGENMAANNTYGVLERYDLKDYVNYLEDNFSYDIGLWGISFGGITAGLYISTEHGNDHIDYVILDSALSEMQFPISQQLNKVETFYPINYMLLSGNLYTRFKLGFSYQDANLSEQIIDSDVPVMIVHSKSDNITPLFMAEDIYDGIKHDENFKLIVSNSQHGEIYFDYNDKYKEEILDFINY